MEKVLLAMCSTGLVYSLPTCQNRWELGWVNSHPRSQRLLKRGITQMSLFGHVCNRQLMHAQAWDVFFPVFPHLYMFPVPRENDFLPICPIDYTFSPLQPGFSTTKPSNRATLGIGVGGRGQQEKTLHPRSFSQGRNIIQCISWSRFFAEKFH